jgi:solute carrier family 45 protein 1/2/4
VGQPLVGVWSDRLTLKFGRRRPFIIGGAVATSLSLLLLSHSRQIVALFVHYDSDEQLDLKTIPFAVGCVYLLDFSISGIQAAARAYIVDNVPSGQQQIANAWAARMTGIGNIAGFILGAINLPKWFPWFGSTQFQGLCAMAVLGLVLTVWPSCWYVGETNPFYQDELITQDGTSTPLLDDGDDRPLPSSIVEAKVATAGAVARTWHAIRRLSPQTTAICLTQFFAWIGYFPMLFYTSEYVGDMYKHEYLASHPGDTPLTRPERMALDEEATRRGSRALLWYGIVSLACNLVFPVLVAKQHPRVPTIRDIWRYAHALFAVLMAMTFFVSKAWQAEILIAILGIVWAVALWAPFVLISEDISRIREAIELRDLSDNREVAELDKYEYEPGVVLGIHNVCVAAPQVISSLASSVIFSIFDQTAAVDENSRAIAWVFRFGGVAAAAAYYLNGRVAP